MLGLLGVASAWQSALGNVAANSAFSTLQSYGATGGIDLALFVRDNWSFFTQPRLAALDVAIAVQTSVKTAQRSSKSGLRVESQSAARWWGMEPVSPRRPCFHKWK